jgi:hypothetical protein
MRGLSSITNWESVLARFQRSFDGVKTVADWGVQKDVGFGIYPFGYWGFVVCLPMTDKMPFTRFLPLRQVHA